jgi:hypothetical protein
MTEEMTTLEAIAAIACFWLFMLALVATVFIADTIEGK